MTAAFMGAPISRWRRRRLSQSGSKSSASKLSNPKESDSSNSPSEGSSDGSSNGSNSWKEKEEMEYQAPNYSQKDSRDDTDVCHGLLNLFAINPAVLFFFCVFVLFSHVLA